VGFAEEARVSDSVAFRACLSDPTITLWSNKIKQLVRNSVLFVRQPFSSTILRYLDILVREG